MQRIIGTEVEYGISSPSDPSANPILTSTQAVLAYAAAAGVPRAKRTRWDYEVESPLRDARGFDLGRSSGPTPIIDADEIGAANMILTNGARLYVDHAHPEYSAPEVTDPMDAVIWDKAGERVMEAAARYASSVPGAVKLQLYKNNVDGKGASYGSHENYLMSRATPFASVAGRRIFTRLSVESVPIAPRPLQFSPTGNRTLCTGRLGLWAKLLLNNNYFEYCAKCSAKTHRCRSFQTDRSDRSHHERGQDAGPADARG